MKKIGLVLLVAFGLLFSAGSLAYGSGLSVGFGYEALHNDLSISVPSVADLKVDISSPTGMYIGEVSYDFNSCFSVKAGYGAGSSHLAGLTVPSWTLSDSLDLDNTVWNVEGKCKLPLSDKVAIAGIAGYAEYQSTINNTLVINSGEPIPASLKQSIRGAYLGAALSYSSGNMELGVAYQKMINPSGSLDAAVGTSSAGTAGLEGLNNSVFNVYLKTNLSKKIGISTGYKIVATDYSTLGMVDVSCNTSGLWLKLQYQL